MKDSSAVVQAAKACIEREASKAVAKLNSGAAQDQSCHSSASLARAFVMAFKSVKSHERSDALKSALAGVFAHATSSVASILQAAKGKVSKQAALTSALDKEESSVVRCFRLLAMLVLEEGSCDDYLNLPVAPLVACNQALAELSKVASGNQSVENLLQLTKFTSGCVAMRLLKPKTLDKDFSESDELIKLEVTEEMSVVQESMKAKAPLARETFF